MEIRKLNWAQAVKHIEDGDVLLFRGNTWVSYFINRASEGLYSHVGIASWSNGNKEPILECVEFREWKGGRAVNLYLQMLANHGQIDVFRPNDVFIKIRYNTATKHIQYNKIQFNGSSITRCMRRLTGLPYGWKRIWWIAQHKLPFLRFLYDIHKTTNDAKSDLIYPVCSTAVAHCFNQNDCDLINFKSDNWTEPSDLATSSNLNYLFTLVS